MLGTSKADVVCWKYIQFDLETDFWLVLTIPFDIQLQYLASVPMSEGAEWPVEGVGWFLKYRMWRCGPYQPIQFWVPFFYYLKK